MNLENLGVVELNAQEVETIDGGTIPWFGWLSNWGSPSMGDLEGSGFNYWT